MFSEQVELNALRSTRFAVCASYRAFNLDKVTEILRYISVRLRTYGGTYVKSCKYVGMRGSNEFVAKLFGLAIRLLRGLCCLNLGDNVV